jgi:cytochrome c
VGRAILLRNPGLACLCRLTRAARPVNERPVALALSIAVVAGMFLLAACAANPFAFGLASEVRGGDPARGPAAIERYGCIACHAIPGVPAGRGQVGPPLGGIAGRSIIAGHLTNTPENLVRWIRDPQGIEPGTVMPNMGVTDSDARDIAAYLYSLK